MGKIYCISLSSLRRAALVCALAVMAMCVFTVPAYSAPLPQSAFPLVAGLTPSQAKELKVMLNEHRFDDALEILKRESDSDPFNDGLKENIAEIYRAKGWTLYNKDDIEGGFDAFRRASAYEPDKNADTYLGLGYGSFRMKNYDDALYYLYDAVYLDEKNPTGHEMIAQIYYSRGRIEDAIEEWKKVLELDPDNEMARKLLDKAKKEYKVEGAFSKNETYYFTIKYEGEEKRDLGYEVLDILDRAYGEVGGDLDYYPNEPVTVVLYTQKQFTDVTDAPSWSGGIFDGTIRIPVGGEFSMERLKTVLYHEYTHYVSMMVAGRNLPTWLAEGIAQYEERWVHDLKLYEIDGEPIPLTELEKPFINMSPKLAQVAYAESLSAVSFFVDSFGIYNLSKLVKLLGEDVSLDDAFRSSTGISYEDFQKYWMEEA